jgi:hypothetical protein
METSDSEQPRVLFKNSKLGNKLLFGETDCNSHCVPKHPGSRRHPKFFCPQQKFLHAFRFEGKHPWVV